MGETESDSSRIQVAGSIALLVLVTEVHYTVWDTKLVLPILFFAIAVFERHPPPIRATLAQRSWPVPVVKGG